MKKTLMISMVVTFGLTLSLHATEVDCVNVPVGMELAKTIEAKEIDKSKLLLKEFKVDVKNYLAQCDKSEARFEETSVMTLTYEDRIADVESDMKSNTGTKVDCSNVPNEKALANAFKSGVSTKIKVQYTAYKTDAESYIEHCALHEEYEFVFEAAMLHDEEYAEWGKGSKII